MATEAPTAAEATTKRSLLLSRLAGRRGSNNNSALTRLRTRFRQKQQKEEEAPEEKPAQDFQDRDQEQYVLLLYYRVLYST